jgi:dihydrofolate reductase
MTAIRLDMTMSLDGFCAGPDDRPGQEMGRGGFRLFNWLDHRHDPGPDHDVDANSLATGAIITGRRTFELAARRNGDHHDGVPILVLTHHVDEGDVPPGTARFYTDVAACAAAARAGAGDRDVMVHGAGAGQALIRAGELDEIEVHSPRSGWVLGGGSSTCSTTCQSGSSSNWCASSRAATPRTCATAFSDPPDRPLGA